MVAFAEILIEGIKQFGGEIIGGILLAVALWIFPGLRKIFSKKDDSDSEVQEQLSKLEDKLNETLRQTQKDDEKEAETRRQLEILQEEEKQLAQLKEILKRNDEALNQTGTQTAEEIQRKAEVQRKLEEQHREQERVKAEIERRQEELRRAEARKAEETRQREEAQRQLEAMQKSLQAQMSDGPTDAKALYEQGKSYYDAKDYERAEPFIRKAAEQGLAGAQCNLEWMYEYGRGVPRNLNEARKWFQKAADQGQEDAKEALQRLNAQ